MKKILLILLILLSRNLYCQDTLYYSDFDLFTFTPKGLIKHEDLDRQKRYVKVVKSDVIKSVNFIYKKGIQKHNRDVLFMNGFFYEEYDQAERDAAERKLEDTTKGYTSENNDYYWVHIYKKDTIISLRYYSDNSKEGRTYLGTIKILQKKNEFEYIENVYGFDYKQKVKYKLSPKLKKLPIKKAKYVGKDGYRIVADTMYFDYNLYSSVQRRNYSSCRKMDGASF